MHDIKQTVEKIVSVNLINGSTIAVINLSDINDWLHRGEHGVSIVLAIISIVSTAIIIRKNVREK